ncbi:MAG TPA: hypothetical protein VKH44_13670 [Pirellulaceae bacterium]|nr:hypothetical protein [Pirellulaceae bacterium]
MQSKSDFWLTLHKLAHDLEHEGDSHREQAASVCGLLGSLSPASRAVYLGNLESVLATLNEVAIQCKSGGDA